MSTIKETLELALEALKVSVPVFLEDFSRHSKATTALQEALASEALEQPSGGATLAQQEPVDTLIAAWQSLEETSGHVLDEGGVEGRMHMSVIRSAWEQMDNFVRAMWDERGRK